MKKILIGIPYLNSGGVEVSLIRFLKEFSRDNKIDLLMLKKEGMYLKDVPSNVNIIETQYDNDIYSFEKQLKDIKNIKGLKKKITFLIYRLKLKKALVKDDWDSYYKFFLKHVKSIHENYDLAIDFHGYGHFMTSIIAEKVNANKKAFWIHDEKNEWINKIKYWLDAYDKVYCVGKACKNSLLKNFPVLKKKTDIFYNLTDYENIRKKALEKKEFNFNKAKLNIVTVGRLEWQKAYDIAVLIAKELKERNIDFNWYVFGDGHMRGEIEDLIKSNSLENCFKLVGIKKNVFPYVKDADMFVLPSRHEGYCLATLEAKILDQIIIATDILSNREQINDGENGFLCKLDPKEFASKIIEVYNDKNLIKKIKKNLSKENFDYSSQFDKLYKLMEE